ncbi:hypothetical protein ACF3NS_15025 [Arsenicicoccus cauae]|uniref:hypothetical protein n=1 Tax=Arsenicicoccus cauae TaxID=2663847 RepID=UPI00370D1259
MHPRPVPSIRPRRDEDVPELARLLIEQQPTSGYSYRNPLPFPPQEFVRREGELAAFVAERDGELLGHVAVVSARRPQDGPAGEVERAYAMYPRLGWVEVGRARPSWLQPAAPDVIAMILPDTT